MDDFDVENNAMATGPWKLDHQNIQPPRSDSVQIALSDLLILVIEVGIVMLWLRNFNEHNFFPEGALTSLAIGALTLISLVDAASKGITGRVARWAFAIGGLNVRVSIVGLVGLVIVLIRYFWLGRGAEGLAHLLSTAHIAYHGRLDEYFISVSRFAIIPLIFGYILQRWSSRHRNTRVD